MLQRLLSGENWCLSSDEPFLGSSSAASSSALPKFPVPDPHWKESALAFLARAAGQGGPNSPPPRPLPRVPEGTPEWKLLFP